MSTPSLEKQNDRKYLKSGEHQEVKPASQYTEKQSYKTVSGSCKELKKVCVITTSAISPYTCFLINIKEHSIILLWMFNLQNASPNQTSPVRKDSIYRSYSSPFEYSSKSKAAFPSTWANKPINNTVTTSRNKSPLRKSSQQTSSHREMVKTSSNRVVDKKGSQDDAISGEKIDKPDSTKIK